eukprot:jgi/Mesvir1/9939/Mv06639-RA.2
MDTGDGASTTSSPAISWPSEADMEEDYRRAVTVIKALRDENGALRDNFEQLKKLHLQLKSSYADSQAKYAAMYDERVNVERQYQQLCQSWRAELESKQRAFEEMSSQILNPKELELLKLRLVEELEAPHRYRIATMERELETQSEQLLSLKRERDMLRGELRASEERHSKDVEVMELEHAAIVEELSEQLARCRVPSGGDAEARTAAQLQAVKRENVALAQQRETLSRELEEARKARDKKSLEHNAAVVEYETQVQRLKSEYDGHLYRLRSEYDERLARLGEDKQTFRLQAEALQRKTAHLEEQLADAVASNDELHKRVMQLEREGANAASSADERLQLAESEHFAEETRLRGVLKEAQDQLEEATTTLNLAQREAETDRENHRAALEAAEAASSRRLSDAKEQWDEARHALQMERQALAMQLQALEDAAEVDRRRHEEAVNTLQAEVDLVRRENGAFVKDLRSAQESLEQLKGEAAEMRAKGEGARSELESLQAEYGHLQAKHREMMAARNELAAKNEALDMAHERLRADFGDLVAAASRDREEQAKAAQKSKAAFQLEKAAALRKAGDALQEVRRSYKAKMKLVKKRLLHDHHAVVGLTQENHKLLARVNQLEAEATAMQRVWQVGSL